MSMPLARTNVMIVTLDDTSNNSRQELANFVAALGGNVLPIAYLQSQEDVHIDVVLLDLSSGSLSMTDNGENLLAMLPPEQHKLLQGCMQRKIPIVEPSWLERVSGLRENEHWSETQMENHVPAVLAMLRDASLVSGGTSSATAAAAPTTITETHSTADSIQSTSSSGTWRRDAMASLGKSISETFGHLTRQNPDRMEEEAIRRAMELSMLDLALVFYRPLPHHLQPTTISPTPSKEEPHEILGVSKTASATEIKTAYRKLARIHHPDKGGDSATFEAIAKAYRTLLRIDHAVNELEGDSDSTTRSLKTTAHWDQELQDHRRLVNDLFQAHGGNLDASVAKQYTALERLGLIAKDAGATNRNEQDQLIHNSCFYLSLASSYLHGIEALIDDPKTDAALIGQTALQLKRVIEAAVVKAHPEWAAQGMVGEEIQAFSDFLTYSLDDTASLLSDWAVVVFDSASGFCDVYKGCHYSKLAATTDRAWARSNTITLLFTPGHYQPLVSEQNDPSFGRERPTLEEVLKELDTAGVLYVITDGS